jgi:hypothetical protein
MSKKTDEKKTVSFKKTISTEKPKDVTVEKKPKKDIPIKSNDDPIESNMVGYKGSLSPATFFGIAFERYVPTYVADNELVDDLIKLNEFELYVKGNTRASTGSPILVTLPIQLDYFVMAMTALKRIHECYPMSPIHCLGNSEFKNLLPIGATFLNYRKSATYYYRQFDISEANLSEYWLTAFAQSLEPVYKLILKASGNFIVGKDEKLEPVKMKLESKKEHKALFIVDNSPFGLHLADSHIMTDECNVINVKEMTMDILMSAEKVVSCCDNAYALASGYIGTDTLVFIANTSFKRQQQYKPFGVTVYNIPQGDEDIEKADKLIKSFIK